MRGLRFLVLGTAALLALLLLPGQSSGVERSRYFVRLQQSMLRAQDTVTQAQDTLIRAKDSLLVAPDSMMVRAADSLQVAKPLDSAAQAALADSLRRQHLYDSLDQIFWGQIDTTTLPCLDSLSVA